MNFLVTFWGLSQRLEGSCENLLSFSRHPFPFIMYLIVIGSTFCICGDMSGDLKAYVDKYIEEKRYSYLIEKQ